MNRKYYFLSSVLLVTGIFFLLTLNYAGNNLKEPLIIQIPRGINTTQTAEILESSGVIKNKRVFLFYVKLLLSSDKIKSGVYRFKPSENLFNITHRLIKGDTHKIKITIPEGWDSRQIANLLESRGIGRKDKFLKYVQENKLEGYLFPETYFFDYGVTEEFIAERMRQEFFRRISPDMISRAKTIGLDLHRWVTLASIIEKESTAQDRRLVSAVFHNRLKKNMYLESCATVLYALGTHKERLTYKDLKVKSPYNTYQHLGLPPGPISNPGLDSLVAALEPEKSDALFFVVDKSSAPAAHIFSRYYKEHLKVQQLNPNPSGKHPVSKY